MNASGAGPSTAIRAPSFSAAQQPPTSHQVEHWLDTSPSGLNRSVSEAYPAALGLTAAAVPAQQPIMASQAMPTAPVAVDPRVSNPVAAQVTSPFPPFSAPPVPTGAPTTFPSGSVPLQPQSVPEPQGLTPSYIHPSVDSAGIQAAHVTPIATRAELMSAPLPGLRQEPSIQSAAPPISHQLPVNAAASSANRVATAHAPILEQPLGQNPMTRTSTPVLSTAPATGRVGAQGNPNLFGFPPSGAPQSNAVPPLGPQASAAPSNSLPADPWAAVYRHIDQVIEARLGVVSQNLPRHVQSTVIHYTDRFGARLTALEGLSEQLRVTLNQVVEQNASLRFVEMEKRILELEARPVFPTGEPKLEVPSQTPALSAPLPNLPANTPGVTFEETPEVVPATVVPLEEQSQLAEMKEQVSSLTKAVKKNHRSSKKRKSRRNRSETDGTSSSGSTDASAEVTEVPTTPQPSSADSTSPGPVYPGIQEIVPADDRFKERVSYRRYRLRDTNARQGRSVSKNLGLQSRRFVKLFQNSTFDGSKPLAVIEFLSAFKRRCDQNGVSEGMAVILLPDLLQGNALSFFNRNVTLEANRSGAATSYPAAINLLLETYATNLYIEQALFSLDNIVQADNEDERQYGDRLQEADRTCGGGVCDEKSLINRAVRGLHRSIKQTIAYRHAKEPFTRFKDVIDASYVAGCAFRVGQESSRQRASTSTIPRVTDRLPVRAASPSRTIRPVARKVQIVSHTDEGCAPADTPTGTSHSDALLQDAGYDGHTSLEYHSIQSPSLPSQQSLDPVQVNATYGHVPHPAQVGLPAPARPQRFQQPGWVTAPSRTPDLESDICYKCFGRGHRRATCPLRAPVDGDPSVLEENTKVIFDNWGNLSVEDKQMLFKRGVTPFNPPARSRSPSPRPHRAGNG